MNGDFGKLLKQLRQDRGMTQLDLKEKSGVSKSQISHVEKGSRKPNDDQLKALFDALELTNREQTEIGGEAAEEGIFVPTGYDGTNESEEETKTLGRFGRLDVIAKRPLELTDISEKNSFLKELMNQMKGDKERLYVYWTVEDMLPLFRAYLTYLLKEEVPKRVVENNIDIITGPKELSLTSFAIYSEPIVSAEREYRVAGRILVRESEDDLTAKIVGIGAANVKSVHDFLSAKHDVLQQIGEEGDYRLYEPTTDSKGVVTLTLK